MNYLAHFQLAWPDPELLAGALEGDYRKGPLRGDLPAGIECGVRLHRAIDAYTDRHPRIEALRRDFPAPLRRYAGILVDLAFDHYLCAHWECFCATPRDDFNRAVYTCLDERREHLSPAAQRMARRMTDIDLLGHYVRWDTVPASAARIGERFTRGNPFLDAEHHLENLRPPLESAFLAFYPELVAWCDRQRRALN